MFLLSIFDFLILVEYYTNTTSMAQMHRIIIIFEESQFG
jgi:hypothetical protein